MATGITTSSEPVPGSAKPLRRDAERNRNRIIEGARAAFAELGLNASFEAIARHADVAVGTVHRHFPVKDLLIAAVFDEQVARLVAIAEQAEAMEDPWDSIVFYMSETAKMRAADRGLKELLVSAEIEACNVSNARARMEPLLGKLVARGKASGSLDSNLELSDLPVLDEMIASALELTVHADPDSWRRYLHFALRGISGPNAPKLDNKQLIQPAISVSELVEGFNLRQR